MIFRTIFILLFGIFLTSSPETILAATSPVWNRTIVDFTGGHEVFITPTKVSFDPDGNMYIANDKTKVIQKYDNAGVYIKEWGTGILYARFTGGAVFAGSYVGGEYSVIKYDTNGNELLSFGTYGAENGQFRGISSIVVDSSGNIYVADSSLDRVQKFNSSGEYLMQLSIAYPSGIDIYDNKLYVAAMYEGWVARYELDGTPIDTLGVDGGGEGLVPGVTDIIIDGSGNFYVTESTNRITRFNSSNIITDQWTTFGAAGSLSGPRGIGFDGSGNIYVADTGNKRLLKFNSSMVYQDKWGGNFGSGDGQFAKPTDMAVDADGNIYVVDNTNDRVQKFDSAGTYITQWGGTGSENGQFDNPTSIAINGSGVVYVADHNNSRIQYFSNTGTYQGSITGSDIPIDGAFDGPFYITIDNHNNIYVTDEYLGYAIKFNSSGEFERKFGADTDERETGLISGAGGIAVDTDGNVYIVDFNWSVILKYNSSGVLQNTWSEYGIRDEQLYYPTDIAIDNTGVIYVVDKDYHTIKWFDSQGNYVNKLGTPGTLGSDNASFASPEGIFIDAENNIYIADSGNDRVQVYANAADADEDDDLDPTPTPTPTPSQTNNSSTSSSTNSTTEVPSCTNSAPNKIPDFFQINRNGSKATLYFVPSNDASDYVISYGYKAGDVRFGTSFDRKFSGGVESITINYLDPRTTYWFTMRAGNGCATGKWTDWFRSRPREITYKY